MLFLPKAVGALCAVAAKDTARWAFTGVRIQVEPHGGFRAEASDGRQLAIVQEGEFVPSEKQIREAMMPGAMLMGYDLMGASPADEVLSGIIPATELGLAFKRLKKPDDRLGLLMLLNEAILVAGGTVSRTPYVQGKWPDTNSVVPKGNPVQVVTVNPELMANLLKLVQSVLQKAGAEPVVTLCFYPNPSGDGLNPFGITAKSDNGLFCDCLLMPIIAG